MCQGPSVGASWPGLTWTRHGSRSLVELLHYCALIGPELHRVPCASSLRPSRTSSGIQSPYYRDFRTQNGYFELVVCGIRLLWINPRYGGGPVLLQVSPGQEAPTEGPWHTLYFLPGLHDVGLDFLIRANRSYYIPGEAVVYGTMNNDKVWEDGHDIHIYGHGTLSGDKLPHPDYAGPDVDPNDYGSIHIRGKLNSQSSYRQSVRQPVSGVQEPPTPGWRASHWQTPPSTLSRCRWDTVRRDPLSPGQASPLQSPGILCREEPAQHPKPPTLLAPRWFFMA